MQHACTLTLLAAGVLLSAGPLTAQESAAERGHQALTGRAFTPATWSVAAYEALWKQWDPVPAKAPEDYDRAVREHYGLHPAPFENGRYPMGLRESKGVFSKGIATDCLLCHGGSILGQSRLGLCD